MTFSHEKYSWKFSILFFFRFAILFTKCSWNQIISTTKLKISEIWSTFEADLIGSTQNWTEKKNKTPLFSNSSKLLVIFFDDVNTHKKAWLFLIYARSLNKKQKIVFISSIFALFFCLLGWSDYLSHKKCRVISFMKIVGEFHQPISKF